jgi:hypothetical protein
MATPRQPVFSNTILQGADYIVSLIQQEKAKAIALTRQELAAEITRRDQAAELAAKESESKLIAALSDASKARAEVENLHVELARANAEIAKLGPIMTIFEKLGFTFGADNTIKANGGLAAVFAGGELGKDGMTVDPSRVLGNLLRTLDGRRAGMLFWGEMYQGLTKEQTQLKENFEAKIAGYVAQIESLQAELKSLKSASSHVVLGTHGFPIDQCEHSFSAHVRLCLN